MFSRLSRTFHHFHLRLASWITAHVIATVPPDFPL